MTKKQPKQPKPVRAWAHLLYGRIRIGRLYLSRREVEYYAGRDLASVIPVEIRPVPKAKARKK